jgi:hypothetical protein
MMTRRVVKRTIERTARRTIEFLRSSFYAFVTTLITRSHLLNMSSAFWNSGKDVFVLYIFDSCKYLISFFRVSLLLSFSLCISFLCTLLNQE